MAFSYNKGIDSLDGALAMVSERWLYLPSSDELPCSDDTPVDNEDQNFIPNLLLFLLEFIWAERNDWFFGVDMGIYHTTGINPLVPVVPDGFLSLGVARRKGGQSRKSYVVWEEEGVVPSFVLEVALGIGRSRYTSGDVQREVLYWYDERGKRYLTPEEQLARYRERFGELP